MRRARIWCKTGYDPVYGARPLKRAIQKQVETRLGRLIIGGKVHDGEEVVVDYDAGEIRTGLSADARTGLSPPFVSRTAVLAFPVSR